MMHVFNYHTGHPRFHFDEASDAAAASAAAAAAAAKPWHDGKADPELVGYMQSKGWDKDPVTGAVEAAKAHREIQKMIGVPADKMLRLPEPSSEPAVLDAFWQKLGAVKEAKDIDFSTVKGADGKPLDEKLAEVIRATAVSSRAPKDIVLNIASALQKHFDADASAKATILAGTLTEEQATLDRSWGANKPANLFIANQALEKLAAAASVPLDKAKAAWDALSKVGGLGASQALNMLFEMGKRMGEAKYVAGGGPGGSDMPMTREAAQSEITALKGDPVFTKRYLEGGVEEGKRMAALHRIAHGQQAA